MSKLLHIAYGESAEKAFNTRTAMAESARCLLCHDAPCSTACPAGTDPGKFIRSLRFHNIQGAAETIRENNPLGGCCALVCPYDNLCEGACSRTGIDEPIQIGKLQSFLVEQEKALGMRVMQPGPARREKVACIGAGPASLACAAFLAKAGCQVTVFEAQAKAGGVLSYGINPTRLPQDMVDFDISLIEALGVRFEYNTRVQATEVDGLCAKYDAVFAGVGMCAAKGLDIPGKELSGIVSALDYLKTARTLRHKENCSHVVIIGGGDVAMDCASSARQLGAEHTSIVYRRSIGEAPANKEELRLIQQLGIPFITGFAPTAFVGEQGKVCGVQFAGRDGYSQLLVKAEKVVVAIGQAIAADFSAPLKHARLFCGGDSVNGGKTVVDAVAEGKKAAQDILDSFG